MITFSASIVIAIVYPVAYREMVNGFNLFAPSTPTMRRRLINFYSSTASIVHGCMSRVGHQFQILKSIIQLVSILVVNYFFALKLSSKVLLHHIAMFFDVLAIYTDMFITKPIDPIRNSSTLMKRISPTQQSSIVFGAESFSSMLVMTIRYCTKSYTGHRVDILQSLH